MWSPITDALLTSPQSSWCHSVPGVAKIPHRFIGAYGPSDVAPVAAFGIRFVIRDVTFLWNWHWIWRGSAL